MSLAGTTCTCTNTCNSKENPVVSELFRLNYISVFRIARQLNFQRILTSATTARIDIPGFPYEAFDQGGTIISISLLQYICFENTFFK